MAIFLLVLATVAAVDSYSKKHIDYSIVPYYKLDRQVKDEGYYFDKELDYSEQEEVKLADDSAKTKNWRVALARKVNFIKKDE